MLTKKSQDFYRGIFGYFLNLVPHTSLSKKIQNHSLASQNSIYEQRYGFLRLKNGFKCFLKLEFSKKVYTVATYCFVTLLALSTNILTLSVVTHSLLRQPLPKRPQLLFPLYKESRTCHMFFMT